MTRVIHEPAALREACNDLRGRGHRVGFVPTMGALHDGHLSLVDAARQHGADSVVLSIFVNPTQFGEGEDFDRYPRTVERDLSLCEARDVALVYAPEPGSMYPDGFQTHVEVETLTARLEGAHRPTHFRGVTTVVTKLFNAVGPCVACFGRKDYQQWRVLDRMARDLDMPVEVVGCPIAREPDGLAMSSRNRYLSPEERRRATALYQGLKAADGAYRDGERDAGRLEALARAPVQADFDRIDYVTVADGSTLETPVATAGDDVVVLMAAQLGQTRLIDNARLGRDEL
ncbi:MAG: pantoate--beta-alanine ligase [Myxococcales bacterium]|jgi:pantoate--beta-alanine ligase